jgi:pSer/pThr/pTyr-binding forkhead associated (FHA) protein
MRAAAYRFVLVVDNDVVLSEPHISAYHAVLMVSRGSLVYEDTSQEGSFIDGRSIRDRTDIGLRGCIEVPPFELSLRLTTVRAAARAESDDDDGTSEPVDFDSPDTRPIMESPEWVETAVAAPEATLTTATIATTAAMRHVLVVTDGPQALRGQRFDLANHQEIVFGRGEGAQVRLADRAVSRQHAVIRREPNGGWRLFDLGSVNGLFVNGDQTDQALLVDGDEIRIGTVAMTFLASAAACDEANSEKPPSGITRSKDGPDGPAVITLNGCIEGQGSEQLATVLEDTLTDGSVEWLIVDTKEVRRSGPASLGVLAAADHELTVRGGGLLLASAPTALREQIISSALFLRLRDRLVADRATALQRIAEP